MHSVRHGLDRSPDGHPLTFSSFRDHNRDFYQNCETECREEEEADEPFAKVDGELRAELPSSSAFTNTQARSEGTHPWRRSWT